MSPDIKSFYGKDVAAAIREACDTLGVAQENLNIEVVETGSKGIFGLISKKAHIRVTIQEQDRQEQSRQEQPQTQVPPPRKPGRGKTKKVEAQAHHPQPPQQETAVPEDIVEPAEGDEEEDDLESCPEPIELSEETLALIKTELERLLELMDCPSKAVVTNQDGTASGKVESDFEEILVSQEGRTLDSLQYLLRKIISKKISGRIVLSIDVGNYRERRYQELRGLALDYAARVKEDGKTQVITSLNPSERRVVHVALQDDGEIRSRSIGEGLFKKVLIYKPGKGKKVNGRKRGRSKFKKKGNPAQGNDL